MNDMYTQLQQALKDLIQEQHIDEETVDVSCAALTVEQAIGNPEEQDYPIQKGREYLVEAVFRGARGQAFSCEGGQASYRLREVCALPLEDDRSRADFIATLNAVFAYCKRCDRTVHCHDQEPVDCAKELWDLIPDGARVALIGLQPRFLQMLASRGPVRTVDMDSENIGQTRFGVRIESPHMTDDVLDWCDMALITGSSIVNGTILRFIGLEKPHFFFGTTIAAAAAILNLPRFCACGHDAVLI
jgi:hypothetical protein